MTKPLSFHNASIAPVVMVPLGRKNSAASRNRGWCLRSSSRSLSVRRAERSKTGTLDPRCGSVMKSGKTEENEQAERSAVEFDVEEVGMEEEGGADPITSPCVPRLSPILGEHWLTERCELEGISDPETPLAGRSSIVVSFTDS